MASWIWSIPTITGLPTASHRVVSGSQPGNEPPQEHSNYDRPHEQHTTCGHAEIHRQRREAGIRLGDAGGDRPETAGDAPPPEPGRASPTKEHRDAEDGDSATQEHAKQT